MLLCSSRLATWIKQWSTRLDMRFLLDEQLPAGLVARLEGEGHQATHVCSTLGYGASDSAVAREAVRLQAALMTKDVDFVQRSVISALSCPIVWIRLGNVSNAGLWQRLQPILPRVVEEINQGVRVVQVV